MKKKGDFMEIRKIQKTDINMFYKMQLELDNETKFMMYEPGERPTGEERFIGMVNWFETSDSCMLIVVDNDMMVGVLAAERGGMRRIRHTAYISTGILANYRHQGIGTSLFREIEKWARENEISRLELTVMCHNHNAVKLYEKSGFKIEGRRENAMKVDGKYVDEYYMAKLL